MTILKQVQAIFGHLAYSKLQLYVPRGLWKHFRMHGEPVNLREQQDADEFFIRLKEAVEDALKALGYEQVSTLGDLTRIFLTFCTNVDQKLTYMSNSVGLCTNLIICNQTLILKLY